MLQQSPGLCGESGPYIFISYARKDTDRVKKFLQGLEERNYRFWYDAGLTPGHEWTKELAGKIETCDCFFAMISEDYLRSDYCETELSLAINKKKCVVPIYLEKTELPGSFYIMIGKKQYLRLDSEKDGIWDKLEMAEEIQKCRDREAPQVSGTENRRPPAGKRTLQIKRFIPLAAAVILLLAGGIYLLTRHHDPAPVPDPVSTATADLAASATPEIKKSLVLVDHDGNLSRDDGKTFKTVESKESETPWMPNSFLFKLKENDPDSIPEDIEIFGKLNEQDEYELIRHITSDKMGKDKPHEFMWVDFLLDEIESKRQYRFFLLRIYPQENSDHAALDWAELQLR